MFDSGTDGGLNAGSVTPVASTASATELLFGVTVIADETRGVDIVFVASQTSILTAEIPFTATAGTVVVHIMCFH